MAKNPEVNKNNTAKASDHIWIILALVSMVVYILWRAVHTLPDAKTYGILATICGILLLACETISMLEGAEHFFRRREKMEPNMPQNIPPERFPHVDIFITTHNEEPELLYKTINGCKYMDYPDKRKVHIFICDDGNRPEVAELSRHMGIGYIPLADNKHAKAGNLNNAISKTNSPWIVTFDADMIPTHEFLMQTVPYTFLPVMREDENGNWEEIPEDERDSEFKIGFIQVPQSFYNSDLFQHNFYSESRIPNEQDYFFREVNVGRNAANAPIYAGSNTLISRESLEEVGGIAINTITEDFETGLHIQSKGYRCYAVDKSLAHGLCPTDIDNLIKQRTRWGRGCIYSLRRVNLLFKKGLKLTAKLSYVACWMYWWSFLARFIFIISPILFVLFGVPAVICTLKELLLIWLPSLLLYNNALRIASGNIRNSSWSNTIDAVLFPYLIIPFLKEALFIRETKFAVTNKTRGATKSSFSLALPQIILFVMSALSLFICLRDAITTGSYGSAVLIFWLIVNGLHLLMAIIFMTGRENFRSSDRFDVHLPVTMSYNGMKYYGVSQDASETGLSITSEKGIYLPDEGEGADIEIRSDRYCARFKARCVRVQKGADDYYEYGLVITALDEENRAEYFQILYDRHHSLATSISRTTTLFDDLFVNIAKRSIPGVASRRSLPRIELNIDLKTADGATVHVLDTNYKYILLREQASLEQKLELVVDGMPLHMLCTQSGIRPGLYSVDNWMELMLSGVFEHFLSLAGGKYSEGERSYSENSEGSKEQPMSI